MCATLLALTPTAFGQTRQAWMNDSIKNMETALVAKYGEGQHARITRGLGQVAALQPLADFHGARRHRQTRR